MIHDIQNKNLKITLKNEKLELPEELQRKIKEHFKKVQKSGANVWDGEIICATNFKVTYNEVKIMCDKSNYSHYLYGERIGLPKEYECRNLAGGCLIETSDGYYVLGELDETTSYPHVLQATGGNIDKKDINGEKIYIEKTIIREAKEELNLDLDDKNIVSEYKMFAMYISGEKEQPGIQVFAKAKLKMNAKELKDYFEKYNKYLKENNLEVEFKQLHFFNKNNATEELEKLDNPKRDHVAPLLKLAMKN